MGQCVNKFKPKAAILAVAVWLCLWSGMTAVADTTVNRTLLLKSETQRSVHPGTPMVLDPASGALNFDLGGSEKPKLQLQLANPLVLDVGNHVISTTPGSRVLGLDAALHMPIGQGLSLHGGVDQVLGTTQFQNLGSIQCLNGTLKPDSYTASGCRFVTEQGTSFDRRTLSLGATHEFNNMTASVNWFTTQTESGSAGVYKMNQFSPSSFHDSRLLTPLAGSGVLPGALSSEYVASESSGIDLNFQVGFTTDQTGDIRLGLALTRVLDANYQGIYGNSISPLDWSVAEPFDSAALGIEWNRGAFSGGIRGFYREPVSFLNRESLDSMSTFDVHFTWHTPWKANLSVGTTNVLGAGADERGGNDKDADRFESIYGRIPYVRYQQDL